MERVIVGGKEFIAGLTWEVVGNGVKDKGAIKPVIDSSGMNFGVKIPSSKSNDLLVGLSDESLKGSKSLAAMVADATGGANTLVVSSVEKPDGTTAWWVCFVLDGFVIYGSDVLYDALNLAVRAAKSHSQLGQKIDRTIVSEDLVGEFPGAEVLELLEFTGAGAKSHEIQAINGFSSKNFMVVVLVGLIVLGGGGYFIYQSFGESLGIKEPEYVEKSPAQILQELKVKSEKIMNDRLIQTPILHNQMRLYIEALENLPLFIAGWEVSKLSINQRGEAAIDLVRREGSLHSLASQSSLNGWDIVVDGVGDNAVWKLNVGTYEPAGKVPELPDGNLVKTDLKDMFQRINYAGYSFETAYPLIRRAEIPPGINFTSPAQVSNFSLTSEGMAYLYGFNEALTAYGSMRLSGIEVAIEKGEYSKWTLKGELYEK